MTKDKKGTKERLLKAAYRVFGRKGYRDATVSDICEEANVNIAAVNYHFGDKKTLYQKVLGDSFEKANKIYPFDGNLPEDADSRDKLRAYISGFMHRIFDEELFLTGDIWAKEMANPTGHFEEVIDDKIEPHLKYLSQIIEEIAENKLKKQDVYLCLMSIIHQCMAFKFKKHFKPPHSGFLNLSIENNLEAVIEHIFRFTLGGIEAVSKNEDN